MGFLQDFLYEKSKELDQDIHIKIYEDDVRKIIQMCIEEIERTVSRRL